MNKNRRWLLPVTALFCCMLWGSAPACIKSGYEVMNISGTGSVLLFAGIRFFVAGVLVIAFSAIQNKGLQVPKKSEWKLVLTLAMLQTFGQYFFYYLGAVSASGIMVSVLSGTSALFALLFSALVFRLEKMTAIKLAACVLGFLGILSMNLQGFSFSFSMEGEGLILMSQICSALSSVCIAMFSKKSSPVMLSGWQFACGGLGLAACGLILGGSMEWNALGVGILLWLAFVSAAAYTLWALLLARFPVSQVGIYNCTIPLFGVVFSFLFLGEIPGWSSLIALVLIELSILCMNWKPKKVKGT